MALQRFVETISVDKRAAVAVDSLPENIKESYSEVQSKSLKESVNTKALIKEVLSLQENTFSETEKQILSKVVNKLKENGITNGPKLYKFPVARINDADHPNLNGRVYTRELWDNVINKQQDNWKGLCGLSDHPEGDDPGQFKQSSIVWLDMMIDDLNKIVWAIGSFVGQYGHLAQEIIEAGGRIGFSSSGFGELMMDGKTVNPDTYQIERVADIVLNPSQGVYGDVTDEQHPNIEYTSQKAIVAEAIKEIPNNKLSENIAVETPAPQAKEPLSAILKEKENTNLEINSVVPETNGENKEMAENVENKKALVLSEAEEKKLKKYIKQFLTESNDIHNPIDRLKELDEIMEMVESGEIHDLKEDVEKELIAERARLEEMVKDAQSIQDEFGVSAKVFAENAKKVAQVADALEEENNNLKENAQKAEKESTLLTEQTHDFETLCAALTERVQTLFTENKKLKKENNALTVENAALKDKASKDDIVVISFGVSPMTPQEDIDDSIRVCKEHGNAIASKDIDLCTCIKDDEYSSTQNIIRETLKGFANPWTFNYGEVLEAYEYAIEHDMLKDLEPHTTSLYFALGKRLWFSQCTSPSVTVTTKQDLDLFEGHLLLKDKRAKNNG